jgi:hypothetical protein
MRALRDVVVRPHPSLVMAVLAALALALEAGKRWC